MRGLYLVALVAVLCLASRPLAAQELRLYVSADSVTVGERFFVSITAEHEFAAGPSFPDPERYDSLTFGDLEVIRRHSLDRTSQGGARIDSVVYEVTTFALDTARVAPIPVLFTAAEDTFTVRTDAAYVPIISLVPADAEDIRDLAPLVEFPISRWLYAAAAGVLLLLAALVAFYLWRRRLRQEDHAPMAPAPPPVPPDVEAYARLKALERFDLEARESIKPYYVELSDTLRTYLWRRLDVHALESTTAELVRALRARDIPDPESTSRLRNVLVQSDYVKFADAVPPATQGREAVATARNIVKSIEGQIRAANAAEAQAHSEKSHNVDTQSAG